MRDGVKIACDLYLPYRAVNENHRLPTLLHITRYNRSFKVNFPFNYLFGEKLSIRGIPFKKFVARGYAVVSCDTRGTGASFGSRPYDFHRDEVQDFGEIMDWVVKQKFSNGKIVSTGISYDGMVSDFLVSLNHKSLVAVASVSSPFDLYRDIIYPGGLYQKSFIDHYLKFTQHVEKFGVAPQRDNICPGCEPDSLREILMNWFAKFILGGVKDVNGDEETKKKAIESHASSYDALEIVHHLEDGINKVIKTKTFTYEMEKDGPVRAVQDTKRRIPMLVLGGFYESQVQNSAVKRFKSLYHEESKLILGPYTHGFRNIASPYLKEKFPCFNAMEEVMRFFDHHLGLDENTGIEDESPIHYYSVGAEKWISTDSWPPKSIETVYHFSENSKLTTEKMSDLSSSHILTLNLKESTVVLSKWNMLTHLFEKYPRYSEKLSSSSWNNGKLNFQSEPLKRDMEISGNPYIDVEITANNKDGVLFAYIQEVEAKGAVNLIMDTQLRLVHRKLTGKSNTGVIDVIPFNSFYLEDREYLEPNKRTHVRMYFPALSYTVKTGNCIKVSLFTFDDLNFKIFGNASDLSTTLQVHSGSVYLPVVGEEIVEESIITNEEEPQEEKDEL
ncbi:predicted protein [Naegleria gruberi]|uniref:Predicted protein n=2 Tax=Naegleria gruberi TaxID=5762 RepID=D2VKI8_NAEGR|nr:uncharacterized protein NAEGRDRAFT_69408 [Naegleria gruberi]EFC42602.1 predicted protein [Naegleria gruberi]|eukprot:XP_002675346.1 predicted protein [Naegleria gruberi strain NEG-M]